MNKVTKSSISKVNYHGYSGANTWYWGDIDIYTLKSGYNIENMSVSDAQDLNNYEFLLSGTNNFN